MTFLLLRTIVYRCLYERHETKSTFVADHLVHHTSNYIHSISNAPSGSHTPCLLFRPPAPPHGHETRRGKSRGQVYASAADHDDCFISDVVCHRSLPIDDGGGGSVGDVRPLTSRNPRMSSQRRSRNSREALSSTSTLCRHAPKSSNNCRGWRAQGLLAGEWRDRMGRHRRAIPLEKAHIGGAGVSCEASAQAASSCAGTEVSFEGLVEELHERLPPTSPHTELAATRKAATTASGTRWGAAGMEGMRSNYNPRLGITPIRLRYPPGCLQLKGTIGTYMRLPPQERPALSTTRIPCMSRGHQNLGPPSLLGPGIVSLETGHSRNTYFTVPVGTTIAETASPSEAMVACAKAHERALPLLQVCATQMTAPAASGQRTGKHVLASILVGHGVGEHGDIKLGEQVIAEEDEISCFGRQQQTRTDPAGSVAK